MGLSKFQVTPQRDEAAEIKCTGSILLKRNRRLCVAKTKWERHSTLPVDL